MADFNCPEMAAVDGRRFNGTKYVAVGGLGREAVGRKRSTWTGYRLGIACALLLTIGSLLMSTICLRSQRKLEAENFGLKEDFEVLETKILNVEEKLSETVAFGRSQASSAVEQPQPPSSHPIGPGRMRRSSNGGDQHRRRKISKAAHYRLDGGEGSTTTELKWRIWNGPDTTSDRINSQYSLDAARLSDDGKSVIITETGLYFIYAQIHFENAMRRNAFAIKVDDNTITRCFQSLDYFNQSLNSTENSRLKTCYSASTVVLRRHQTVSLANLYPRHRILNDPYANYWGIVKFAEA